MDVELRDIHPILVTSKTARGKAILHLEGRINQSMGGIKRIASEHSNDELRVTMELGSRNSLSPEINFETVIPSSVERVVFGREQTPIWDRAHGPLVKPTRVKVHRQPWEMGFEDARGRTFDWDAWNRHVDQSQ
ncbi:hypothetical protein G5S37_06705 [Roseimicrobium sp. ORNL1]|nr:hypothetical protein G5S37_06705 [Roseimicrobium sp. ORNL1]